MSGRPSIASRAPGTVAVLGCHTIRGGYGDRVVGRVESVLRARGEAPGSLATVDRAAPVVVVAHAAPRGRAMLPTTFDTRLLGDRDVGLVVYGTDLPRPPVSMYTLRDRLQAAGARVLDIAAVVDTTQLPRPGERGADRFDAAGLIMLHLVLDELELGDGAGTTRVQRWQ